MLSRQLGHPQEAPQLLSRPVPCCTTADTQNLVWIKSQVKKDHGPFMSLLHSGCNSPASISHKIIFVLFPFFESSIYLSFCSLPTGSMMLWQAVFSSTARPPDQHQHHQHLAKALPLPPARTLLLGLSCSCTPCTERASEVNLPTHGLPPDNLHQRNTIFLSYLSKCRSYSRISTALTKPSCSSDPSTGSFVRLPVPLPPTSAAAKSCGLLTASQPLEFMCKLKHPLVVSLVCKISFSYKTPGTSFPKEPEPVCIRTLYALDKTE